DRRLCRERAHRLLVVRTEFVGALLLGEGQVPERRPAIEDRGTQKAPHRRMIGWKTHRLRMRVEIPEAKGGVSLLQHAEQTEPRREGTDTCSLFLGDPRSDELLDESIRVKDAERGVLRVRDSTRL